MAEINSTYIHGINKDINPLKADNNSLFHLENGRILTDDNGTAFSIQNIKGNTEITITDESVDDYSNYEIVGHETFGKDICVFYVSNTVGIGGFPGRIALLKYVSDLSYKRFTLYNNEDFKLKANDNFRSFKCYESEFVKKVYFCSDTIRFMHLNIAIGDADPNLDISYEDIRLTKFNQLFIVGNVRFSPITFVTYGTGTLGQGSVQYSYRFYNSHGAETVFSQPSAYIALSKDINKSVSQAIRGKNVDDPEASSNKSVTMTVDLTNGGAFELYQEYDYIEIVRLYYSNIYSVPEITIIYRGPTKATITFTDEGGVGLGSLIYADFLALKRDFTFRTSAEKFNMMFLGNIQEEQFDVTFDARVYRYRKNTTGTLEFAVVFDSEVSTLTPYGNWLAINTDFEVFNVDNPSEIYYTTVPLTHDCINRQNDLALDYTRTNTGATPSSNPQLYDYKYNTLGQLGASGPNVEVTFEQKVYKIDDNTNTVISRNPTDAGHNNRGLNIQLTEDNRDWILGNKRGWQRDEIYRFGVVFFDANGRQSFVHWIGDIRMPSITDYPITYLGIDLWAVAIYPVVTIKTMPTGAVGYKIVNVKREESDKTIVTQGLLSDTNANPSGTWGNNVYSATYKPLYSEYSRTYQYPMVIMSPEISFNKKNYAENSFIELLGGIPMNTPWDNTSGTYVGSSVTIAGHLENTQELTKLLTYENITATTYIREVVDSAVTSVFPTMDSARRGKYSLMATDTGTVYYVNYLVNENSTGGYLMSYSDSGENNHNIVDANTAHGTSLVVLLNPFGITTPEYCRGLLVNIKKLQVTQYNGNTYNDRLSNTYITASDTYYSSNQSIPCYYGDTFVCYFDYLRGIRYDFNDSNTFQDILYFPVESSINLNLRYDLCYSRVRRTANVAALTEQQGIYQAKNDEDSNPRYDFKQETDLYLYADIHSKPYDCQKYYPRPLNFEDIEHSPTSVIWSKKKIDGEDRDSWLVYGANDRNNLPKVFGELNKMVNFFGQVYCWQEDAVSMAQIEPQVIQGGVGGEQTIVGTGTTLGRFTTLQNDVGINNRNNLIQSVNAIYWLDVLRRKIYSLVQSGEIVSLSDTKMIEGYMRYAVSDNSIMLGVYDNTYAEVLLTLRDSEEIYNTITEITPPVTVITLLSVTVGSKITLDLLGSPMTFTASTATTSTSHFAVGATLAQTMTNFGTMFNSYLAANGMSTYYTISTEDNTITIKGTGVVAVPDFNTSVNLASVSSSIDATLPGGQKGAHIHLLDPDSSAIFNDSDVAAITNIHVQVPAYTMTSDCVVVVSIYEPGAPDKFEIWKKTPGENNDYVQVATSCMDEYFDGTNPLTSSNYGVQTGGGKTYKFYNDWLLTLPYGQPHNGKNVQDCDGNGILDDNDRWMATNTSCAALFKQAHYAWKTKTGTTEDAIGLHAADCGESEFFLGKENANGTQIFGAGNTNTYPIAPYYDDRSAAFQADTGIDPWNPDTYLMSTPADEPVTSPYFIKALAGTVHDIRTDGNGNPNKSYGQLMWYKAKAGDKIRIKVTSTTSEKEDTNDGSGWKYSFRVIKTNKGDITFTTEQQTASSISYTTVTTSSILTAVSAGNTISVQDSKYFDIEPNGTYRINGEDMVITDKSSTTFTTGYLGPGYIDLTRYSLYNNNTTIVFSEKLQQFIGFYTFVPKYYIDCQGHYLTSADNIKLWKHNYGDKGKFYGLLNDMRIEFYVSINSNGLAEWNNLRWYSEVYDADNKLLKNNTITSIRVRNAYQQTDEIVLYPVANVYGDDSGRRYLWTEGIQIPTSLTATYGNVNKVIDHWVTSYPRMPLIAETVGGITGDYSPIDYSGDYNLGVAGTYNSSATSDRLRSPFVKVTMFFTNADNKLINLYDITSIVDVKLV
jgi:hypothetical protein